MSHDYMRRENVDSTAELGTPNAITLHWSAGTHDQTFDHYHINITGDGTVVQTRPTHGTGSLGSHTWHRNTGNIGIGICAMADGVPITPAQEDSAARTVAELMGVYGIPITAVHDHVYYARLDGYGPGSGDPETRIDLSGTTEGKAAYDRIIAAAQVYRAQIVAGTLTNSLTGRLN